MTERVTLGRLQVAANLQGGVLPSVQSRRRMLRSTIVQAACKKTRE